jgi:hypothetical protein
MNILYDNCYKSCMDCVKSCIDCINMINNVKNPHAMLYMQNCLQCCRECSIICKCYGEICAINGGCIKEITRTCIKACEICIKECSKHEYPTCKKCVQNCSICIQNCTKLI